MKLYDSLSQTKTKLTPLTPGNIKIYVCGITPYDTTHLGHAYVYTTFDALIRYLKFKDYRVTYTQNVTDVDDDLLKRAKKDHKNWKKLGDFWTNKFLTDMKALNIEMPDHFTKASDFIEKIIEITQELINKGFAYEVEGNVFFKVAKYPEYGKLSKYSKKEMEKLLKERGGDPADKRKRGSLDFLLWQKSLPDEPYWESPWENGRPGWHVECSAMITKTLGDQIDIHGGGFDLIYPHHESERAQSESFSGKVPFVKNWLHIAMLSYQGQKMSKSLGNLVLVSDLLKKYDSATIRWLLLSHHYRKPWEFETLELEKSAYTINHLQVLASESSFKPDLKSLKTDTKSKKYLSPLEADFNSEKLLSEIKLFLDTSPRTNSPELKTILNILNLLGFRFSS